MWIKRREKYCFDGANNEFRSLRALQSYFSHGYKLPLPIQSFFPGNSDMVSKYYLFMNLEKAAVSRHNTIKSHCFGGLLKFVMIGHWHKIGIMW